MSIIKERLQRKLNTLQERLGVALTSHDDLDEIVEQIRQAEQDIRQAELIEKVETINKREKERRELMRKVLAVGPVNAELLTNDLKLNKTKRKQAPELFELVDNAKSAYFTHGYHGIIKMTLNHREFETGFTSYESGSTSEVKPFKSFEHACECNGVLLKSITVKQVQRQIDKIMKANEAFEAAEKKFNASKKANNEYFLRGEGFIQHQNSNTYINYTSFK